jgi:hypothetical protein
MNAVIQELAGWRSYRRYYAKMPAYYRRRLEDNIFDAVIVCICGVFGLLIIVISAIWK